MNRLFSVCILFLGIILCSCMAASTETRIDSFLTLPDVEPEKEMTLSGYLFTGTESSGLYRFDDTHKSGKQCVRMNYNQVKKLKVGSKRVVVKGLVRQSKECSSGKLICLHACQDHYFESFTILKVN